MSETEQTLADLRGRLAAGEAAADVYRALRPVLGWPAELDDVGFTGGFGLLAEVSRSLGAAELGGLLDTVARQPDDPNALYQAAYQLYEQGQGSVAATLLDRANRIAPGQPPIVTELSSCLESEFLYGPAALVIDGSGLAETDPMCAYLSGFNHLMSGDVAAARARLPLLEGQTDETLAHVREALRGMILRCEAIQRAGIALDHRALGAWHAGINGAFLLHESPYGYDEPMFGRYAYVSDSPGLQREGLERLATLLPRCNAVSRVVSAPDRASRILALAAGEVLGLPVVDWSPGATGLVVTWSLEHCDGPFLSDLREHRPETLLFAHASNWVEPCPLAPDVTTLLCQVVTHPFTGGAIRVDPDTQQAEAADPDARSDEACAADILAAAITDPSMSALDDVLAIAEALASVGPEHAPGLQRTSGHRTRQRAGSPVGSARFT